MFIYIYCIYKITHQLLRATKKTCNSSSTFVIYKKLHIFLSVCDCDTEALKRCNTCRHVHGEHRNPASSVWSRRRSYLWSHKYSTKKELTQVRLRDGQRLQVQIVLLHVEISNMSPALPLASCTTAYTTHFIL